MWLSAVKVALLGYAALAAPQLSLPERTAWKRVEPSVVFILRGTVRTAGAALIDSRGWFIADENAIPRGSSFDGEFSDGQIIHLELVKIDGQTQLALLRSFADLGTRRPLSISTQSLSGLSSENPIKLIAALPGGPIRAELVRSGHLGILNSSRAVLPLTEIQFESAPSDIGGALAFSLEGDLVGVLAATLRNTPDLSLPAGVGTVPMKAHLFPTVPKSFGPAGMTVAYSPSPYIMRQVVEGFLSPSHEVQHPVIGVFVREAGGKGAYVDSVQPGSSAQQAGIHAGDIITEINGTYVVNQINFARIMLKQHVGSVIPVRVLRAGKRTLFRVRVGR